MGFDNRCATQRVWVWLIIGGILLGENAVPFASAPFALGCDVDSHTPLPRPEKEVEAPEKEEVPEKTPEEQQQAEAEQIAQERAKIEKERLENDLRRITNQLQISLDDTNLWLLRARIYEKLDRREAAITDLSEVIKRDGASVDLLTRRSALWLKENEFEKAESDANEAIKLDADDPAGHFALGKVFLEQWEVQQAYNNFKRTILLDPNHKMARYNRAYVILTSGSNRKGYLTAVSDLEKVIELDPDMMQAHYDYAHALYAVGRLDDAARQTTFVLMHNRDLECMYLLRWRIHLDNFDFESAVQDATRFIEFRPEMKSRYDLRAKAYYDWDEFEKSIADWNVYIEAEPDDPKGYRYRGRCNESLWRYKEALADYEKLIEIEPESASNYGDRAGVLKKLRRFEEAFADIDKAMELDPESPNYWHTKETVYREMGEHAQARFANYRNRTHSLQVRGRMDQYNQEQEEERLELVQHVEEQIAKHRSNEFPLGLKALRKYEQHDAFIPSWLDGITPLLTDSDPEIQQRGITAMETLIGRLGVQPLTKEDTTETVSALEKIAQSEQPEDVQTRAQLLIDSLAVVIELNDPNTFKNDFDALTFDRFNYTEDPQLRPGCFRSFGNIPRNWRRFVGHNADKVVDDFIEIKRTKDYIELYSHESGTWVRLYPTKAETSPNRVDWSMLSDGELVTERPPRKRTRSKHIHVRYSADGKKTRVVN